MALKDSGSVYALSGGVGSAEFAGPLQKSQKTLTCRIDTIFYDSIGLMPVQRRPTSSLDPSPKLSGAPRDPRRAMTNPDSLILAPVSSAPLAAGLFGGAPNVSRRAEPLAETLVREPGVTAASRRQSFSDLFRTDGEELHAG